DYYCQSADGNHNWVF
nr:immunoglobulin light chain junction region [Macaca mulatta]MOW61555.1 immunoglobulin light chain junction region [Macaca mulatta]